VDPTAIRPHGNATVVFVTDNAGGGLQLRVADAGSVITAFENNVCLGKAFFYISGPQLMMVSNVGRLWSVLTVALIFPEKGINDGLRIWLSSFLDI
jgi:hypothetical protein